MNDFENWGRLEHECYSYANHLRDNKDFFGNEEVNTLVGFVTIQRQYKEKAEAELKVYKQLIQELTEHEALGHRIKHELEKRLQGSMQ